MIRYLTFLVPLFIYVNPSLAQDGKPKDNERKDEQKAAITMRGEKGGPVEIIHHGEERRVEVVEEIPPLNRLSEEAMVYEAEYREWLKALAEAERKAREAAEAEAGEREIDQPAVEEEPELPRPPEKNWITLTPYHKQFPRHLVDPLGNPIPLPHPNPFKNVPPPLPPGRLDAQPSAAEKPGKPGPVQDAEKPASATQERRESKPATPSKEKPGT